MRERGFGLSAIIPTLNAVQLLEELIRNLKNQSIRADEIHVIDSESTDGTAELAASLGCSVCHIPRREFDHGGTRNFGAERASGEILVFLTQDVLPNSAAFLDRLTAPIREGRAVAAYARQVAPADAKPLEIFARQYNYPPQSSVRHIAGLERRTLRSFFFSNAASAVSRASFNAVGRFPAPVRTNEDMLLCARLLDAGQTVAYVADAEVIHSHDFSLQQVFRRYFRIGAVAEEYRDMLRCANNSADGFDFVSRQIAYLCRRGHTRSVPRALVEACTKAVAYRCGRALQTQPRVRMPQPARSVVRN